MKLKKELTATNFRILLIVGLVVIAALGAAAFVLGANQLRSVAEEVNIAVTEAGASSSNLETLQRIERELATQQDTIKRTSQIVAESQSYRYQDQIIADLSKYASQANITITDMTFDSSDSSASSPSAGSGSAGSAATNNTASAAAPSGVKSTTVSIALDNPVNYNDILRFIRLIEQNLTKMQVSRIGLSSNESNEVSSDALTIEVYIR